MTIDDYGRKTDISDSRVAIASENIPSISLNPIFCGLLFIIVSCQEGEGGGRSGRVKYDKLAFNGSVLYHNRQPTGFVS